MADTPQPPPSMSPQGRHRIGGETVENVTVEPPGGLSTSPEAVKVLKEQGVAAWRAWVADHAIPDE